MATRIYLRKSAVNGVLPNARDIVNVPPTSGLSELAVTVTQADATELPLKGATADTAPGVWVSDRVDQDVVISGLISFQMNLYVASDANITIRVKLSKISAGGSDIEEPIGTFDATTEAVTNASVYMTFSGTPAQAVTVYQSERFVVRVFAIPLGGTMTGGINATFGYSSPVAAPTQVSYVNFTETFGLLGEGGRLHLLASTVNGIGSFMDLMPGFGVSSPLNGITNTTSGGSDIQWTKTAGGAVAEWISQRIARSIPSFTTEAPWPEFRIYAYESAAQANAQVRAKLWKRNLAGTETLIHGPDDMGRELTTNSTTKEIWGTTRMTTSLDEDDRIVLRLYLHNFGTMGSGRTATVKYDGDLSFAVNSNVIIGSNDLAFKLETEPNGSPARVPGNDMMMGLGN